MERKAARCVVELMRAHSEVGENPVGALVGEPRKYSLYVKKVVVYYADILSALKALGECRYRFGVAVNGDEPAVFREPVQYRVRVAAVARGAVRVQPVRLYVERINRLVEKYGNMFEIHAVPPSALKLNVLCESLDFRHILRALLIPYCGIPYLHAVTDSGYQRLFFEVRRRTERVILPCLSGTAHLFELLAIRSAKARA